MQVTGKTLKDNSFEITSNFVVPELPIQQGSYLELTINRTLAILTFELISLGSSYCTRFASMSEIEIYVNGTQKNERLVVRGVVNA